MELWKQVKEQEAQLVLEISYLNQKIEELELEIQVLRQKLQQK